MNGLPVIRVQLVHIQGPLKGQIQEFTENTITVGRHPSCSVRFPVETATISRRHAELVRVDNRYKIIDRSTNGTFVNGKKITESFLKDGDVIMFTDGGPKVSFLAAITGEIMSGPESAPPAYEVGQAAAPSAETPKAEASEPVHAPAQRAQAKSDAEAPPRPVQQAHRPVLKVPMPLIIQFGPTLRSYKELPVTIGKGAGSDFVLSRPDVADEHARIFFSDNQYWVRDLTGKDSLAVNGATIGFEAPLRPNDVISLIPGGPAFCFVGEGRLAEHEEAIEQEESTQETRPSPADDKKKGDDKKGKSFLKDLFRK